MIAGESLIFLRDRGGALRAFFNVCRHRGTRLCTQEAGHFSETIQCQYHAWTYCHRRQAHRGAAHGGGGRVRARPTIRCTRPRISGVGGVPLREPGAQSGAVRSVARPADRAVLPLRPASLKVGHRVAYDVHANWKLVFQNYSECLHCPMIHPGALHPAAVPERRERPDRGAVPRRVHGDHGAGRERDDERRGRCAASDRGRCPRKIGAARSTTPSAEHAAAAFSRTT